MLLMYNHHCIPFNISLNSNKRSDRLGLGGKVDERVRVASLGSNMLSRDGLN